MDDGKNTGIPTMKVICKHKSQKSAPWVLYYRDKTYTKYVCINCERKLLKRRKHGSTL